MAGHTGGKSGLERSPKTSDKSEQYLKKLKNNSITTPLDSSQSCSDTDATGNNIQNPRNVQEIFTETGPIVASEIYRNAQRQVLILSTDTNSLLVRVMEEDGKTKRLERKYKRAIPSENPSCEKCAPNSLQDSTNVRKYDVYTFNYIDKTDEKRRQQQGFKLVPKLTSKDANQLVPDLLFFVDEERSSFP